MEQPEDFRQGIERSGLLSLATELVLAIFSSLDLRDVLMLRQTCKTLFQISNEPTIWASLLQDQAYNLPIPQLTKRESSDERSSSGPSYLELVVKSMYLIGHLWPRRRTKRPYKLEGMVGKTLLGLQVFQDRWLLVVYSEGLIYLWDIHTRQFSSNFTSTSGWNTSESHLFSSYNLGCGRWTSYTACLNSSNTELFVAITRAITPCCTKIYRIGLSHQEGPDSVNGSNDFQLIQTIHTSSPESVRALEPTHNILALSLTSSVELISWSGEDSEKTSVRLHGQTDDLEDLWNGILAVRFSGPFILLFKPRSIELHHYASIIDPTISSFPNLKHRFTSNTFRNVTISSCQNTVVAGVSRYVMTLFAYDILRGLCHYTITVTVPGAMAGVNVSDIIPEVSVALTGLYDMSDPSNTLLLWNQRDMPMTPSGHSSGVRNGFVSAHALGPQGKRAVWVQRRRETTEREILVWGKGVTENSPSLDDESEGASIFAITKCMVYFVSSYDLRDDVTHCALGEVNGLIILGNRSGEVFILELNDT